MTLNSKKYGLLAGLVLGAGGVLSAQAASSILTFSVDMSAAITGGTFVPGVDTVAVRGTFNAYGTLNLVQQGSSTIYTNTVNDTTDANGGQVQYKFWTSNAGGGWENTANGQNRAAVLPSTSGGSLTLPACYYADAGPDTPNDITFQVDMAEQIQLGSFNPGTKTVEVQGDFNSWTTGSTLIQQGSSTIYTNTFTVGGSPGRQHNWKFVIQPDGNYENPSPVNVDGSNNRFVPNVTQTLAVLFFSDLPFVPTVTNQVTFSVDMGAQILAGNFNPGSQYVCVNGAFNGWASGNTYLTNNGGTIYTNTVEFIGGLGSSNPFKYVIFDGANTTWENLSSSTPQLGGNRFFNLVSAPTLVLPLSYFSDQLPNDLLPSPVTVTFSVNMAGAVGTESYTFTPGTDKVFLNGQFSSWWAWGGSGGGIQPNPIPDSPAAYEMTRVGTSLIYTNIQVLPAGTAVALTYKYGINGFDDEAGFGVNHVRYVRTLGSYALPQDTFGTMTVEPSFGNLAAGAPSAGHVPITWLGRPGVKLQTTSNLPNGWADVVGTDGASSTNYPVGPGAQFFRLIQPGLN
ncbi:MAG: hypothetical protein U1F98_04800 [Verrucomicrobiota bacterium]